MRLTLTTGMLALTLAIMPIAAQAGTLEGAAIGAGTGAIVAGPPGAVVGGVIGAVVGGPDLRVRESRRCWINRDGNRRCERR